MSIVPALFEYIQNNLALLPIPKGRKGPTHKGWNAPDTGISDIAELSGKNSDAYNWGIHHLQSRTCAIDIDDLPKAKEEFASFGLDLDAYLAKDLRIESGRPGRAKLLYRLPESVSGMVSKQLWAKDVDGKRRATLNFRCATKNLKATVQDVLPPSIHPETEQPYQWVNGSIQDLKEIPSEILSMWQELLQQDQVTADNKARRDAIYDDMTIDQVRTALTYIDPDVDRNTWVEVCMAVHAALYGDEQGYDAFEEWSATGAKYQGEQDCRNVWNSVHEEPSGITFRTLQHYAAKNGWKRPPVSWEALVRRWAQDKPETPNREVLYPDPEPPVSMPEAPVSEHKHLVLVPKTPINGAATWDQMQASWQKDKEETENKKISNKTDPEAETAQRLKREITELFPIKIEDPRDLNAVQKILYATEQLNNPGYRDPLRELIQREAGWTQRQLQSNLQFLKRSAAAVAGDVEGALVFPHINRDGKPKDHSANLRTLCEHKQIRIRHNRMSHDIEIYSPEKPTWLPDEKSNLQRSHIRDLCVEHNMPTTRTDEHINTLGCDSSYHPMEEYLRNAVWDGQDWFRAVANTVYTRNRTIWELTLKKWAISVCASVREMTHNRPPRGVLVMTGKQLTGKTSWFRYLSPSREMFGESIRLNPTNKDSLKVATKYAIVELGELDATFNKSDIASLKAFISASYDEVRLPYARTESTWPRRTIYCGTVNNPQFLSDNTGNTRFWTNEIHEINLDAMEAMQINGGIQQFWAQINAMLNAGDTWWMTKQEMQAVENNNEIYVEGNMYEELLLEAFCWPKRADGEWVDLNSDEISINYVCPVNPMRLLAIASAIGVNIANGNSRTATQFKNALTRLTGQRGTHRHRAYVWDSINRTRSYVSEPGQWYYMPYLRTYNAPVARVVTPAPHLSVIDGGKPDY